jgi:hypothetical protein
MTKKEHARVFASIQIWFKDCGTKRTNDGGEPQGHKEPEGHHEGSDACTTTAANASC